MKLEYDKEADAAYLYIKYPIKEGEAKKIIELNEDLIVDYDKNNKLLGIEILNASRVIGKEVLKEKLIAA